MYIDYVIFQHSIFKHNNGVTKSLVGQSLGGVPTLATWFTLKHVYVATFNKSGLSFM